MMNQKSNSRNLDWNREKWGSNKKQDKNSTFSSSWKIKNDRINNDTDGDDWRSKDNKISSKKTFQSMPPKKPFDDGKVWTRGGEAFIEAAINLINEMCKDEYFGPISQKLLDPKVKISILLNNEKKFDLILSKDFLKVILKDSEDNLLEKSFRDLLMLVLGSAFATQRMDSLINRDLATHPSTELLLLVVRFLKLSFQTLPGLAFDIFHTRAENLRTLVVLPRFEACLNEDITLEMEELRLLTASSCAVLVPPLLDAVKPPDDYRDMTILPTMADLCKEKNSEVFLRENKQRGAYESVEVYLDVQFRLMREDFMRPLREGVTAFRAGNTKNLSVRVYREVRLLALVPDKKHGITHTLQLDMSRLSQVKWNESKRFMNGALLCLSMDNFDTFTLATVTNRAVEGLLEGQLTVKLLGPVRPDLQQFTMLESVALFEGYSHVLARLKKLSAENMCMQQYVVQGAVSVAPPSYLGGSAELEYTFNGHVIHPSGLELWPPASDLGMNESQGQAFRSALTSEMAIIQGPPGTGKTFLGLKICQCLLENVRARLSEFGPLLVVCYTNHALDQFLEGISAFTQSIVRVGGGCKSDPLLRFLLKNENTPRLFSDNLFSELKTLESEIHLREKAYLSFIRLEHLSSFIPREHLSFFEELELENWLQGEDLEDSFEDVDIMGWSIVQRIVYEEVGQVIYGVVQEALRTLDEKREEVEVEEGFTEVKGRSARRLFINCLRKQGKMSAREAGRVVYPNQLLIKDRWRLYRYWRSLYVAYLKENSKETNERYEQLSKRFKKLMMLQDENTMRSKAVIGMTTTQAAKYGKVLEKIGCKIVIVEEAAEVIESHVIASLSSRCEHLILIGDHKQLRPSPAVFELARKYGLDLSLFERLINNQLAFTTLSTQHRMRPEIAQIMRFIYPELRDHDSVLCYPDVPAIHHNLFFFNHFEREERKDDSMSYLNQYEADFVVKFCRHLIGNGVRASSITVLSLYSAQNFLFGTLVEEGVRTAVVDNYQGEENDIVLLSLVRSNEYEQIGFLSIENRICVSLSRAKHGLYVFGNFDILMKRNKMWRGICEFLKEKKLLGKALDLFCQNHPSKRLTISDPSDFEKYPDCGCEEMCKAVLSCGHVCPKFCHFLDRDHLAYQCVEDCTKMCVNKHPCRRRCHQSCGNCGVLMDKTVPVCGHTQLMECYVVPIVSFCKTPCQKVLACKHVCTKRCGEVCGLCETKVFKGSSQCSHTNERLCHEKNIRCDQICDALLDCSHSCQGVCHLCQEDDCHELCQQNCDSRLVCAHTCRGACSSSCYPCRERCPQACSHSVCGMRCGQKCYVCQDRCQWQCPHKACTKSCEEACDREICDERCCSAVTCACCGCMFECYSVCGEQCRDVCPICDPDIKEGGLYVTLWTCGHSFKVAFMDAHMSTSLGVSQIVRRVCPTCGAIINRASCFRYMNMLRALSVDVAIVQKSMEEKIKKLKYSEYFRIVHSSRASIFPMFAHYQVTNYLLDSDDMDAQDSLYNAYFTDDDDVWRHVLVAKYRVSVLLLHKIYKDLHSGHMKPCLCHPTVRERVAYLIEWLNPNVRTFDDHQMEKFDSHIKRIIGMTEICKNKARKHRELHRLVMSERKEYKADTPLDGLVQYMENLVEEDSEMLEELNFNRRRWFKCSKGHIYDDEDCAVSPPPCFLCALDVP